MSTFIENGANSTADGGSSPDGGLKYQPFIILEQHVHLDFTFRDKKMTGSTRIRAFRIDDSLEFVTLDARQSEIDTDGILVNGQKVKVQYTDPSKRLDTPEGYTWGARQHHLRAERMKPLQPVQRAELPMTGREKIGCQPAVGSLKIWLRPEKIVLKPQTPSISRPAHPNMFEIFVPFCSTHIRDGLHFVGSDGGDDRYPHLYTRHSYEAGYVSSLFPCVDDRTRLERWMIHLTFPRTVADALDQPLASHATAPGAAGTVASKKGQQRGGTTLTEEDKLLDMTAVCAGTLVGEHDDENDPTKKVMEFEVKYCGAQHIGFAIGPFEDVDLYSSFRTEEDEMKLAGRAVKIHGYCLPGRSAELRSACQPLANATDYFTLNFAKYPFDDNSYKICFVDDMVEDTVPLQGFSLATNRLLYPEDIIDTELDVTRKLVHTIASQYYGVFLTPNELTDTWIVTGLAYYMTDQYMRKLAGNNYFRFQMRMLAEHLTQIDHGRPSLHDLGRHLALGPFEMDFMALKAPLVMFILDRRLMKSSNSSGVTRVISQRLRDAMQAQDTFAVQFVVSSEQFRRQCEKRGRLRLEDFWDQWVMSSGCPRFTVSQRFNKKRLEVEVTVIQNQVKWSQEPHLLEKEDFWRDIVEERHNVEASEVPLTFTGPMTFRVHEADGTPYEHCLEIKLDAAATKGSRLSMPYNTKYKRIKRARHGKKSNHHNKARDANRMDEDGHDDDDEKHGGHNSFGDVLVEDDEMASWKLVDWDEDMQAQMDQESYEWIRVDCDFEWIYSLETNFKVYMTVAQLQQDRDVVGQAEAMLTLMRNNPSNIQTTMLLRTLYDDRYFFGIRQLAAQGLTRHAEPANNFRGMHHLIRVYKNLFCFEDTTVPRPNDFTNKKDYLIQKAIPMALAKIRGGRPYAPEEARKLILDQLTFNKNDENYYSDQFYVATLLKALATSLIQTNSGDRPAEPPSADVRAFLDKALEQIDRYEGLDEWVCSYNNLWVVTALDCKMKLMKSGVIDTDAVVFMKYTLAQNNEAVQIKAFEALVELGYLLNVGVMKLLLCEISTHRSPYVRDQLFKLFTRGLAAIAFGELDVVEQREREREPAPKPIQAKDSDGDDLLMDDDDDGGLIMEQSDDVIKRRQEKILRQKDITAAIKALKEAVKNDEDFERELWKAVDSRIIGIAEKRNLLDLCATLFPEEDEMLVTMRYPGHWTVSRDENNKHGRCVMNFKQVYKTSLKRKRDDVPAEGTSESAAPVAPSLSVPLVVEPLKKGPEKEDRPQKKIKISLSGASVAIAGTGSSSVPSPAPVLPLPVRQPSVTVASPRPQSKENVASIATNSHHAAAALSTASVSTAPVMQAAHTSPTPPLSQPRPPKSNGILSKAMTAKSSSSISKKRKLDSSGSRMVTMKYRKVGCSDALRTLVQSFPSSLGEASHSDSMTATAAARTSTAASSMDAAASSGSTTISAGSSQENSSQKTTLPNGKVRRPLPGAPTSKSALGSAASSTGKRPSSTEPSQPKRKVIKLSMTTKALREAAARSVSAPVQNKHSRDPTPSQKPGGVQEN